MVVDASKKQKVTLSYPRKDVTWVPLLMDGQYNPIPTGATTFAYHLLATMSGSFLRTTTHVWHLMKISVYCSLVFVMSILHCFTRLTFLFAGEEYCVGLDG